MEKLVRLIKGDLKIGVNSKTGQLCSICKDHVEFMWGGGRPDKYKTDIDRNPNGWNNSNLIMFPLVGPSENGKIKVGKKEYEMGQHGIARHLDAEVHKVGDEIFVLQKYMPANNESEFPFSFYLDARYSLNKESVLAEFNIKNKSNNEIPCSLGWHPAFYAEKKGIITDISNNNDKYTLDDIFKEKTLLLEDSYIVTYSDKKREIELKHNLGNTMVWSKEEAPVFVCIEPVTGLPEKLENGEFRGSYSSYILIPNAVKRYAAIITPTIKKI